MNLNQNESKATVTNEVPEARGAWFFPKAKGGKRSGESTAAMVKIEKE